MISGPYVPPNPWTWSANDVNGVPLTITVQWNASTRALQGATVVRASGCLLTTIMIGLGADGTPDTSPNTYTVAPGTTNVSARTLSKNGLNTIDDVAALQVTAA